MLVAAVLIAQYAGTLDLLDTTKVGLRSQQPLVVTPDGTGQILIAGDVSTTLTGLLRLRDRRWDFSLSYSPSLSAADVEVGVSPMFFQSASTSLTWHSRSVRISISELGSYGLVSALVPYVTQDTTPQPGMPGRPMVPATPTMGAQTGQPAQQPLPGQTTLLKPKVVTFQDGSSDTNAIVSARASQYTSYFVSGGYHVGGGLGSDAQQYLPEQYGGRASVGLANTLARGDSIATSVSGQDTVTPSAQCSLQESPTGFCRQESPSGVVQTTFRHQFSRVTVLSLTGGASVGVFETTNFARELAVEPVAGGTLSYRFDDPTGNGRSTGTFSAQLAPSVDIRTGLLSERLSAVAAVTKRLTPTVILSANASWLQSAPFLGSDPYPLTSIGMGLEARIRLDRRVDVGLGGAVYVQRQDSPDAQTGTTVAGQFTSSQTAYVAVTARAPTLYF